MVGVGEGGNDLSTCDGSGGVSSAGEVGDDDVVSLHRGHHFFHIYCIIMHFFLLLSSQLRPMFRPVSSISLAFVLTMKALI